MMALEFESTGEAEISLFQRLSLANGTNPLRLAPCPVLMALQALWVLLPDPLPPPEPLPPPDPLPPLPEPLPPDGDEKVEPAAPPPQFTHESAIASTAAAAVKFFQENFMPLFSQEIEAKTACSQAMPRGNRDMYHQHLAERSKKDGGWSLVVGRWPKPRQPVDQRLTTKDQRATANDGCSLMARPGTRIRRSPQPRRLCRRHRRLALLCLCSAHGCFR